MFEKSKKKKKKKFNLRYTWKRKFISKFECWKDMKWNMLITRFHNFYQNIKVW